MKSLLIFIFAAGLAVMPGAGLIWAGGPPNPTMSDGAGNTAGGTDALFNVTGFDNTGFGEDALNQNTTGSNITCPKPPPACGRRG
jgi:hypothetical protein